MDLICKMIQLRPKLLHRRVHEQSVRETAALRAVNLLGYLLQTFSLNVDPNVELVGIGASVPVDIANVAPRPSLCPRSLPVR
jgi:hypothetical protein